MVRDALVRHGEAVFRCALEQDRRLRSLDVPQWMFDRAVCDGMGVSDVPTVNCNALLELQELLHDVSVGDESGVIQAQHRSSNRKGAADGMGTRSSSPPSTRVVSSTREKARVQVATAGAPKGGETITSATATSPPNPMST